MAAVTGGPVLVTGAAGFIGYHVSRRLLESGRAVVGVDNLSPYYDPKLKEARIAQLAPFKGFRFVKHDLTDRPGTAALFEQHQCPVVIHLGGLAGVRYSLLNPAAYVDANLIGFGNVLEGSRLNGCRHLLYASTSSVYGANTKLPYSVHDAADHPLSFYGATKRANELMAHAYSNAFSLPATGLRFFTVYGPWGRPDMAMWMFTAAIMDGTPVRLFNGGRMLRDYTYVDDVVEAVTRLADRPPAGEPHVAGEALDLASSTAPWRVYNIGNSSPVETTRLVDILEKEIGRPALRETLDLQPGDALSTCADVSDLERDIGFSPSTSVEEGARRFVSWYRTYRGGR